MPIKRIHLYLLPLGIILALFAWHKIYHATKIKDVDNPRFNMEAYRFEDYINAQDNQRVLDRLFPIGTPREKVDEFLVKKKGAKAWDASKFVNHREGSYVIGYEVPYHALFSDWPSFRALMMGEPFMAPPVIYVEYSKDDKLEVLISKVP